jgi:hypothetical protein
MDLITDLERHLKGLLRGKFTSVSISFNEHSSSFMDAKQIEEIGDFKHVDWVSATEKSKAIENNSVWNLHCYPDTPGGFYSIGASSLSACLEKALGSGGH